MESEDIVSYCSDRELVEDIVLESGGYRRDGLAVPHNIDERVGLESRAGEGAGLEEVDRVSVSCDCGEGLSLR